MFANDETVQGKFIKACIYNVGMKDDVQQFLRQYKLAVPDGTIEHSVVHVGSNLYAGSTDVNDVTPYLTYLSGGNYHNFRRQGLWFKPLGMKDAGTFVLTLQEDVHSILDEMASLVRFI